MKEDLEMGRLPQSSMSPQYEMGLWKQQVDVMRGGLQVEEVGTL